LTVRRYFVQSPFSDALAAFHTFPRRDDAPETGKQFGIGEEKA
jgi:hypothetical protein